MEFIQLTFTQVLISLLMILLAIGLSILNRSRLESQLMVGAFRSFVQLWIVGYVLWWLFQSKNPWLLLLTIEFQLVMGSLTAGKRQASNSSWTLLVLYLSLHASVVLTGTCLYWIVFQINPFDYPHLLIPLMGMTIGNSANGAALSIHRLQGEIDSRRGEIEAALALGATPSQSIQPYVSNTIRNALIPTINSMMLMGIVQLPGIMSGQMIAGIVPEQAIRYQIIVVYMLVGSVMLTCHLTVLLESKRYFSPRWGLLRSN